MANKLLDSTLTIAKAAKASNSVPTQVFTGSASAFLIMGPSALTGLIKVEVSFDNVTFKTLRSGGLNINIGADEAIALYPLLYDFVRVVSSTNEDAERKFSIKGVRF